MIFTLHNIVAWLIVFANIFSGFYAICAHIYVRLRTISVWRVAIFAQSLFFLQAILGVMLIQGRQDQLNDLHMIYGFFPLAAIAFVFAYKSQMDEWRYLLYGFTGLFLAGMALRNIYIGGFV